MMSTTINEINPSIDQTVRIFDQFYNYSANVPAQDYDLVLSYFKSVFSTIKQAEVFTSALFRVAETTNTPVTVLLQSFEGQALPQVTITMAYYLNSVRSPATLLGVLQPAVPNYYTARNVKA